MIIIEDTLVNIENLIYTIREKQVIFDYDVARLYGYETKRINEAVYRNKNRFPDRFCFRITKEELENLRSHNATSVINKCAKRKYLPYVFTEQGIAMLSCILKNEIAINVSISIMDAFAQMRKFIFSNSQIFEKLINLELKISEHDKKLNNVFNRFNNIEDYKIFYDGQIYDSYSLIIDIIESAENKIVIIDNYIDKTVLKMLTKKKKNVNVVLITSNNSKITKLDRAKFNQQYPTLKINTTKKFHDRFIIIDDKTIYHCGASLKDLGKRCFAITKMEDKDFIQKNIYE